MPQEEGVRFEVNVNFINNYLSRAVRKLKIETDGSYNLIGVELCKDNKPDEFSDYFKTILIHEQLDMGKFQYYKTQTQLEARYDFYLTLLEMGYKRAYQLNDSVPVKRLVSLHDEFRAKSYKNEWIWKRVTIREKGLQVFLKCYMTTFEFRLELEAYVYPQEDLVCQGIVLRTAPFEESYVSTLRKVQVLDDVIAIIDHLGFANITIDIHLLQKGVFNVTYHDDPRFSDKDWYIGWGKKNEREQMFIKQMLW